MDNSDFEEDISVLQSALDEGKEKKIDLHLYMQDCLNLFTKVVHLMKSGNANDKEFVHRKLNALASTFETELSELCKQTKKSEEELEALTSSPSMLDPSVLQLMQNIQTLLSH